MSVIFKSEKDAISLLGLLNQMYQNFDEQFTAPDNEKTHSKGLNILALITDNATGTVLGLQRNSIHAQNNPLLHAEQLTLKEAVATKNKISPRDPATTSVESYYRNLLFNDPNSFDALLTGATIYTTLEPCPYCSSALLVSRVKRIVFITPDNTYGNSFYYLWSTYYKKYDIHYEQLSLPEIQTSSLVKNAKAMLAGILKKISEMSNVPGTLYFDTLKPELKDVADYFKALTASDLTTSGDERVLNKTLLENLGAARTLP